MNKNTNLVRTIEEINEEKSILIKTSQNSIIKFLIGYNPIAAPVMGLLSDRLQKYKEVKIQNVLLSIAHEIEENKNNLQSKIDKDFLETPECAGIVEGILIEVTKIADKEKLRFLKDFLTSSILKERPDVTWQELFLKYLTQLAGIHLAVLEVFYQIQGGMSTRDRIGQTIIPGKIPFDVETLTQKMPSVDLSLLRISCIDLANLGLIVDWRHLVGTHSEFQKHYCITDNGLLFMRYVTGAWNQSPQNSVKI